MVVSGLKAHVSYSPLIICLQVFGIHINFTLIFGAKDDDVKITSAKKWIYFAVTVHHMHIFPKGFFDFWVYLDVFKGVVV